GYWFSPCAWGKGYATQACRAVLAQAFRILGAEHIDAAAYTDNAGSLRVLEKLGFEQTGMGVHTNPTRGEDADAVDMRLTRERFEARFGALETEQAA
ncbi:MAG: GNAT family protein, partial [Pseudomonadota bacterium]